MVSRSGLGSCCLIWFDAVDFTIGALCLLMPVSPFGVPAASKLVMHDTAVCCAVTVSRIPMVWVFKSQWCGLCCSCRCFHCSVVWPGSPSGTLGLVCRPCRIRAWAPQALSSASAMRYPGDPVPQASSSAMRYPGDLGGAGVN